MSVSTAETLRLPDGRDLEFAQYGSPGGVPVFFFHGFIGSHHQASVAHPAALSQGVRLIAPSRPGVGRSTPRERRCLADVAEDVGHLADALGLDEFGVVGVSGGGPYALACLKCLPGRIQVAAVLSGLGPLSHPTAAYYLSPAARRILLLGRRFPPLARYFFERFAQAFRRDPEAFLAGLVRSWSHTDQELFARPGVREMFLADLEEVLLRGQGADGLVREMQLYFRWGFRLQELARDRKVLLWHGRNDELIPPLMSVYMAGRLPRAEAAFYPGGHFMALTIMDQVLGRTREGFGSNGKPH